MEDSFSNSINSQRENKRKKNASEESGPDDLTNLNWVAGIPVPMNASVSPPDGSRARKSFSGSSSTKNLLGPIQSEPSNSTATTPNYGVPVRTKAIKTALPTYKIVVKDRNSDALHYASSSNSSSPEKRDSVILANIVASHGNNCMASRKSEFLCDKIGGDEEMDCADDKDMDGFVTTGTSVVVEDGDMSHNDKPNCSYTCLIGMALKASSGCLPVNAIYQYIEKEFPYFINAPDGWKNSVRHNLSLNPIFRKVNREGWTGKKGYLWEVCPDKQDLVDKEILRFLHTTGKKLGEFTAPMKASCTKYKQRCKKPSRTMLSSTPIFCSRCTRIVSPTPQDSSTSSDDSSTQITNSEEIKKFTAEMQEEAMTSEVQVKSKATATQSAFDTGQKPSKYMGVESPPSDPSEVAREVFNLCPSPDTSAAQFYSPMNYGGAFFPFYPPPNQFGIPYENLEAVMAGSSSNSSATSPNANGTVTATMLPPYPQYAMPFPFPYFLGGQYPMYSPAIAGGGGLHQNSDDATPKLTAARQPVSVKVLTSSDQVNPKEASASNLHLSQKNIGGGGAKKGRYDGNPDYIGYGYSNVAGLSAPLKKMKVFDGQGMAERRGGGADESISSYFADVSTNGVCSDEDDAEENAEVSSIMSLLSQQQGSTTTPALAGLGQISTKEKEDLEQITGTSDLSTLLNSGLESMKAAGGTLRNTFTVPPDLTSEPHHHQDKFLFGEDCTSISAMDVNDIDAKVATAQEDNYYLPSIDSLLNIGDGTIVTMKAAMNLDIQGVVEISTVDDQSKEEKEASLTLVTDADTSTEEIQID